MSFLLFSLSGFVFFAYLTLLSDLRFMQRPLIDRIISAFLLTTCQIVLSELLLGLAGLLYSPILVVINIITSFLIIWIVRPFKPKWQLLITESELVIKRFWKIQRKFPTIGIMTFWLFLLLAYHTFVAWIVPATQWDSFRYHLPAAVQMIQNHNIYDVVTDTVFINTYPKNFELLFLWIMIIPGHSLWVNAGQIPFLLIGILATFRLLRLSQLTRYSSWMMAVLLASAPVILQQLTKSMIDVMFSMTIILAIWAFYRYIKEGSTLDLVLSGMALGLATGGKTNGILVVITLGGLLMFFCWRRFKNFNLKNILKPIFSFILPIILLSSYWYVKNFWVYGNPVEPYHISILGHNIFEGEVNSYEYLVQEKLDHKLVPMNSLERLWYIWQEPVIRHNAVGENCGLGSVWFILMLPALPIAFLVLLLKRTTSFLWLYSAFLIPFILFLRYQWNTRYHIYILALGLLAFGIIIDEFKSAGRILRVSALLLFLFSSIHGSIHRNVNPSILKELMNTPKDLRTVDLIFSYDDSLHGSLELLKWWHDQKIRNTRLMYHCDPWIFTYPFWDVNLSNRIYYLQKTRSFKIWQMEIETADWLLVSLESQEEIWTDSVSSFKKAYSDEKFVVYKKTD